MEDEIGDSEDESAKYESDNSNTSAASNDSTWSFSNTTIGGYISSLTGNKVVFVLVKEMEMV